MRFVRAKAASRSACRRLPAIGDMLGARQIIILSRFLMFD
jgi:hypothetical protein